MKSKITLKILITLLIVLAAGSLWADANSWSDNFNGGAQQVWTEADNGTNTSYSFNNDRYNLYTQYGTTDGAAVSYVAGKTGTDCIMQAKVEQINSGDKFLAYLIARTNATSMNAYTLGISSGNGVDNEPHLYIGKLTGGVYSGLGGAGGSVFPWGVGNFTWHDCYLKFAVVGNNMYGKVWKTTDPEPVEWQVTATDASFPNPDVSGVMLATYHTLNWDEVQVAFDDVSFSDALDEVWVDDGYTSSTLGWGITHFDNIQDAIDAVASGGTVNVVAGTYTIASAIDVDKGVTITGNTTTPANVVVTYSAPSQTLDCFDMQANDITVQGIKVVNGRYGFNFAATNPSGCTISNCFIDHAYEGAINIDGGSGHTISNNTITNCLTSGTKGGVIDIYGCPDTIVDGNNLTGNGLTGNHATMGIYVKFTYPLISSERVEVINNNISGMLGINADIQIYDAPYTYIYNNTISNSEDKGIAIFGIEGNPAYTSTDNRVEIIGNNISSTYYPGLQACNAPYTYFYDNTLTECNYYGGDGTGDFDYASIHIDVGSSDCLIDYNTVSDGINGIQLWSDDCTVTNNTIYDMGETYADTKTTVDGTYYNSAILYGDMYDVNMPTSATISFNNIYDNYWGLFVISTYTGTVTAEKNWWGNASGPSEEGPGTGDAVSANVDYSPWWGANYVGAAHPWTWYVNTSNNSTIQEGIDAASAGDIINVTPGTYYETHEHGPGGGVAVDIPWFAEGAGGLTIQSTDGPENTIIDCDMGGADGWAAWGVQIVSNNITFSGFTVKNAYSVINQVSGTGHNLSNLILTDFVNYGLGPAAAHNCTFSNITIHTNDVSNSENRTVKGIDMQEYGSGGNTNNTFEDITIYDIETTGEYGVSYGIYWEGDNAATHPSNDNTFTNLTIYDISGTYFARGLYLESKESNAIENATFSGGSVYNVVDSDDTTPAGELYAWGIYVRGGVNNLSISGFNVTNCNKGIYFSHSTYPPSQNVYIHNNNIAGNTEYGVQDYDGDNDVDATLNYWGPNGPESVVSGNVAYIPWWADEAMTIVGGQPVTNENKNTSYATIQAAITAASPGDVINVAAGTYTEQINIEKSLTITGSGTSVCNIVCPAVNTMTLYATYSTHDIPGITQYGRYSGHRGANIPIVRIAASDVTFQGFHINFNNVNLRDQLPVGSDAYSRGVGILVDHVESTPGDPATVVTYTGITIQNNKIDGMLEDTDHVGIKAMGNATVSVLSNTIYGYGESAISAQGVDAPVRAAYYPTVTANSNTIYGGSFDRSNFSFMGIGYWSGGTGSADGNTIYNTPNDWGYALATWTPNAVSFTNNTVTTEGGVDGAGCGAQLIESSALTVSGNTFEKQFLAGWLWSNPTAEITNNIITNCTNGFVGDDLTSGSVTLHYNKFSGISVSGYAVDFDGQMTPAHGWTATPCTITANATKNYWGDAQGPKHSTNPYNSTTNGNAVSDNVTFMPWYATASTTPATENATLKGNYGSKIIIEVFTSDELTNALIIAATGDSIILGSGTFTGNFTVNADITISAAPGAVPVIQTDNAGTALTVDSDGTGGVILEGLTFTDCSTAVTVTDANAVTISNSNFEVNTDGTTVENNTGNEVSAQQNYWGTTGTVGGTGTVDVTNPIENDPVVINVTPATSLIHGNEAGQYDANIGVVASLRAFQIEIMFDKTDFNAPDIGTSPGTTTCGDFHLGSLLIDAATGAGFTTQLYVDNVTNAGEDYYTYKVTGSIMGATGAAVATGTGQLFYIQDLTSSTGVTNLDGSTISLSFIYARDELNGTILCSGITDAAITIDSALPVIAGITDAQNGYYATAPVLSSVSFSDNYNVANIYYQYDGTAGSWTDFTSEGSTSGTIPGTSWSTTDWILPDFGDASSGLSEGSHTIYFQSTDEAGNTSANISWQFNKDTTAPVALTWKVDDNNHYPETTVNANNSIALDWNNTNTHFAYIHIWRKAFGDFGTNTGYPTYTGTAPTSPTLPADPKLATDVNGWTKVTKADITSFTNTPATRGFYYYVLYVEGLNEVISAVSVVSPALSYWLGDVNATPDGEVKSSDIALLGAAWNTTPTGSILDVGPTTDNSRNARPVPDDAIDFEDLMIFAMNYENTDYTVYSKKQIPLTQPIFIDLVTSINGNQLIVELILDDNNGFVRGLHIPVNYGNGLVLNSVTSGDIWNSTDFFIYSNKGNCIEVDGSVLGELGIIENNGTIATLTFDIVGDNMDLLPGVAIARSVDNEEIECTGFTLDEDAEPIPTVYKLYQNYPNPFNKSTKIMFALPQAGKVKITVYNIKGQLVDELTNDDFNAGNHIIEWNNPDLKPGMYFYRIKTDNYTKVKKCLLIR